jgi:hypothetical protein
MKRFLLKILLRRSIGNRCVGEDLFVFYNRYGNQKIVQDWLFGRKETGIIWKKRWKLIKPLSKLLPKYL